MEWLNTYRVLWALVFLAFVALGLYLLPRLEAMMSNIEHVEFLRDIAGNAAFMGGAGGVAVGLYTEQDEKVSIAMAILVFGFFAFVGNMLSVRLSRLREAQAKQDRRKLAQTFFAVLGDFQAKRGNARSAKTGKR
jgi:uncharacterized membrane protein YgdD (TMEM256/DUF423 family)